jgi:hypothetical protein
MKEIEARMRRDYVAFVDVVREAQSRGLAKVKGYASVAVLLQDLVRVGPAEARRRVEHAAALHGDGPVTLPVAGQAARDGEISSEHLRVIHKHVAALPDSVGDEQRADVERRLVLQARIAPPRAVDAKGKELRGRMGIGDEDWVRPRNELRCRVRADGRLIGRFDLAAENGALFQAALSPLSKPEPAVDGVADQRSTVERWGDAFAELIRIAVQGKDMPTEGGEKPHIAVTVPLEVLEGKTGKAILDGAGYISAEQARYLACDAKVFPMVLGKNALPVNVAVPQYTVPKRMRRALVQRDRGCAFPTCSRHAAVCHSHHVTAWPTGPTVLPNLVLLCPTHHRLIHASEWQVTIVDGRPEFTPPAFIDPHRTPRRNEIHHRI